MLYRICKDYDNIYFGLVYVCIAMLFVNKYLSITDTGTEIPFTVSV